MVWLTAFGESAIEHEILVWIGDPEAGVGSVQLGDPQPAAGAVQGERHRVPYPQRDVHVKEWPA